MTEVVLVTGSETLTGRKLIEKLLARGSKVVATVAGKDTEKSETSSSDLTVLTWNRSSWFSTKTVIRETLRLHGRIDAGWILHQGIAPAVPFSEAVSSDIEDVLEQTVKGSIAMTRELSPALAASGGFLGMVLPHRSGGEPGPLESMADGAYAGFASSFVRNVPPGVWSCGFFSTSPDADGFTASLISQWDERPGKLRGRWYRYSEGRRPFGRPGIVDTIH